MTSDNAPNDLRNLWQNQIPESTSISIDEIRRASHELGRKATRRNTREYLAAVVVVAAYGFYFFHFQTWLLRIGSALEVLGVLWVMFQLRKRGSARIMASGMDADSCLDFHRAELVRQRDLHSTAWKWYLLPFVPGLALFLLGQYQLQYQLALARDTANSHRGSIGFGFAIVGVVIAVLFVLAAKLNSRRARKLQQRIDELDAMRQPPGQIAPTSIDAETS